MLYDFSTMLFDILNAVQYREDIVAILQGSGANK
ncbi:hypothetical protein AVEN_274972-1, partial [Araneus ventricosus]